MPEKKLNTENFHMRVDEDFFVPIDAWRAKQRPIPSRSEAIRLLIDKALAAEKKR
jgi:hypothetical protein